MTDSKVQNINTKSSFPEERLGRTGWDTFQREKPDLLLHLLDFPYNDETKTNELLQGKLTDSKYHLDVDQLEIAGLVNEPIKMQAEVTVTVHCSDTIGPSLTCVTQANAHNDNGLPRCSPQKKFLNSLAMVSFPNANTLNLSAQITYLKKNNVFNYAVSVPLRKLRASSATEVLAWDMNDAPLPKIHGAPLRLVVTAYIGAHNCKWVYKINVLKEPSMGPVQRQEYLASINLILILLHGSGNKMQNIPIDSRFRTCQFRKITTQNSSYSGGGNWIQRVKHYYAWRSWKFDLAVVTQKGGLNFYRMREEEHRLRNEQERLRDEEDHIKRYLHTKTSKEFKSKCEHLLIRKHSELM
ncbi:Oxidoreductase, molybdopterin-binding domain-containing protein [Lentinula edodes]|nr:Oxidoreductase, molybdopterin-binding domain-containing protein [Lentinula edodes]